MTPEELRWANDIAKLAAPHVARGVPFPDAVVMAIEEQREAGAKMLECVSYGNKHRQTIIEHLTTTTYKRIRGEHA